MIEKHNFVSVYFYVWPEYVASKGTQEVGSCLLHYSQNFLKTTAEQWIFHADTAGGQNRSIKLFLFLQQILQLNENNLKRVTVRYFKSGHSYNDCDTDFAAAEKALKKEGAIYDYDSFVQALRKSKPNVTVIPMTCADFYGVKTITKQIINRKKSITGEKISWLKSHEISIDVDAPFILTFKDHIDQPPVFANTQKIVNNSPITIDLLSLSPLYDGNYLPLSQDKLKSLKDIRSKLIMPEFRHSWNFLDEISETLNPDIIEHFLPQVFEGQNDDEDGQENDE